MIISASRQRMATKVCSISRAIMNTGTGKPGAVQVVNGLELIQCTARYPLSENAILGYRAQDGIDAQAALWQLMVMDEYDIRKGDVLKLDEVSYSIVDVQEWSVRAPFMVLTIEDVMAAPESEAILMR